MYFSVAEQEQVSVLGDGKKDGPKLSIRFSVGQPDTSKCLLTVTAPDGKQEVFTFARNGYMLSQECVEPEKEKTDGDGYSKADGPASGADKPQPVSG